MLSGFKFGRSLAQTVPYNYTTGFCVCFQGNTQDSEDKRSHLSCALFKAAKIKKHLLMLDILTSSSCLKADLAPEAKCSQTPIQEIKDRIISHQSSSEIY